jgi:hypothetical protein
VLGWPFTIENAIDVASCSTKQADLVDPGNKLGIQTSLTERGNMVAGVGYTPNGHDILTGSQMDGTAFPPAEDRTCRNWTSSTQGAAMVGHADRKGLNCT